MRIEALSALPLSVPLREPFVIASGRIDVTRAALVRVELRDEQSGRSAVGLGEAAALPPVTPEDQPDLLAAVERAAAALCGASFANMEALAGSLDAALTSVVTRAGVECALLDAWARLSGVPVCALLRARPARDLHTDITLPIADPARMAELARDYRAQGFRVFKIKVGKDLDDDARALEELEAKVPDARFRLDANGGFGARAALELLRIARAWSLELECFEQPCARDDLEGMARVARDGGIAVIADESVRDAADFEQVIAARAAHGVNLKLAKSGGLLAALALGERARSQGLSVMCGGMVETRLGMSAMAHVACALPEVEYVDLDTAFLLADDPFSGGYRATGPTLHITGGPGLDVTARSR